MDKNKIIKRRYEIFFNVFGLNLRSLTDIIPPLFFAADMDMAWTVMEYSLINEKPRPAVTIRKVLFSDSLKRADCRKLQESDEGSM